MLFNWARFKKLFGLVLLIGLTVVIFGYQQEIQSKLHGLGWLFPALNEIDEGNTLGTNASVVKIVTETGEIEVSAEVARSTQEISQGLMYRESLCDNCGMLFYLPQNSQTSFWMKNCKINLDMIFIDSDGEIIEIKSDLPPCYVPPCPLYRPVSPYTYVLEMSGGWSAENGVTSGDTVVGL